jgi:hypothetical protein
VIKSEISAIEARSAVIQQRIIGRRARAPLSGVPVLLVADGRFVIRLFEKLGLPGDQSRGTKIAHTREWRFAKHWLCPSRELLGNVRNTKHAEMFSR